MKFLSLTVLLAAALSGCTTTSNTVNNANIRGTNTNTGYVTNTNAVAVPTIPANTANLTPGNMSVNTNAMTNTNRMTNSNAMSNSKVNANAKATPR